MNVTLKDFMNLEPLKSVKLLGGVDGLNKRVTKVGILDYEFTRKGAIQCIDRHWECGELVLTTFLYAAGNSDLLLNAVKRLERSGVCGLAIKNVFLIDIDQEVIRYANSRKFPLMVFTDHSLFFEDIIIAASDMLNRFSNYQNHEKMINKILLDNLDKNMIKSLALQINYALGNFFNITYIKPHNSDGIMEMERVVTHGIRKQEFDHGDVLVKYKKGIFYVHSMDDQRKPSFKMAKDYIVSALSISPEHFYMGSSNDQFFLANFKEALLQSYYAASYCELYGVSSCDYDHIGIYKLLFGGVNESWLKAYIHSYIPPIMEFDAENKSNLFDTLMEYERHDGRIKDTALALFTHENTIRYRLKKVAELFGKDFGNKSFELELLTAIKIQRIQSMIQNEPYTFE